MILPRKVGRAVMKTRFKILRGIVQVMRKYWICYITWSFHQQNYVKFSSLWLHQF